MACFIVGAGSIGHRGGGEKEKEGGRGRGAGAERGKIAKMCIAGLLNNKYVVLLLVKIHKCNILEICPMGAKFLS
jgi:hypothetical protein